MNNKKKAKFITFEGGEGSGKTTQSKKLYDYIISKNIPVILTREIGGTEEAEKIRDLIMHSELLTVSELLLVLAARYEHVNKVIIPALKKDIWVICDRFIDSTICYQGAYIENGAQIIFDLHQNLIAPCFDKIHRSPLPDITFFIDLPPIIALERTKNRNDTNKFDEKEMQFHEDVYQNFLNILKEDQSRIVHIKSAELSKSEIHKLVVEKIDIK